MSALTINSIRAKTGSDVRVARRWWRFPKADQPAFATARYLVFCPLVDGETITRENNGGFPTYRDALVALDRHIDQIARMELQLRQELPA